MNFSYWVESTKQTNFPSLAKDISTDVLIIGGGITGILTAYMLSNSNLNITIVEADKMAMGVTANTTAKITSQHGLLYDYLLNSFDFETAKGYLDSNEEAIKLVSQIVEKEKIDCDFSYQDSYVYTCQKSNVQKIVDEVSAITSLGLKAEYVTECPLPFNIEAGIKFPNQAQFHPRKYLLNLLSVLETKNINLFENSKVIDIKHTNNMYEVYTNEYKITTKYLVMASHYPIKNFPGMYFIKMYQDSSYAIGVELNQDVFDGMYISCDFPSYSFRNAIQANGKKLLIVGGLGEFSNFLPNMYVATGYKKWGMTTSHVAAKIISDKILNSENPYEKIYTATRLKPIKNSKEFGNMLKQSAYSLAINKLTPPIISYSELTNDSGGVVNYNGKKLGIYKDKDGKKFAVLPYCKHLGCELSWNNLEKTWDCPCHGSRYDYTGKIITEPTTENLDTIDID